MHFQSSSGYESMHILCNNGWWHTSAPKLKKFARLSSPNLVYIYTIVVKVTIQVSSNTEITSLHWGSWSGGGTIENMPTKVKKHLRKHTFKNGQKPVYTRTKKCEEYQVQDQELMGTGTENITSRLRPRLTDTRPSPDQHWASNNTSDRNVLCITNYPDAMQGR